MAITDGSFGVEVGMIIVGVERAGVGLCKVLVGKGVDIDVGAGGDDGTGIEVGVEVGVEMGVVVGVGVGVEVGIRVGVGVGVPKQAEVLYSQKE